MLVLVMEDFVKKLESCTLNDGYHLDDIIFPKKLLPILKWYVVGFDLMLINKLLINFKINSILFI